MQTTDIVTDEQAVESLLAPEVSEESETEETVEAEEAETEEELELEADSESSEGEEVELEESDDEEELEEEGDERPELYAVKVDGKEVEVTLDDLTRSYSGQQYIQKGMQEAAEAKKQAEAAYQTLQQEQARVAQLYQTMSQTGVVAAPIMPDHALATSDPIGYMEALGKYNADKAAYDAQQAELQNVTQQQSQAQEQAMRAYAAEQEQVLLRDIPDFADPEKGKKLKEDLRSTGERYGFTADELSSVMDARAIKLLHDAMKYQQIVSGKSTVEKKAKKARPVTKPKGSRKVAPDVKRQQNARKALKQTGSMEAALDLIYKAN